MDDYAKRRLAELHAAAPVKRKKAALFAVAELDAAAKAFAAMKCPKAMVWLWLVHQSRKTGRKTVAITSSALAKYGVGRELKRRGLKELETAGLIAIERQPRKNPIATLL